MAIDVTAKSATAVAYDTAANADAYFLARGITTWTGTESVKEENLILGADYLDRLYGNRWLGRKTTQEQSLDWPRSWLEDRDGYPIDADIIPEEIKKANFEAALLALTGTDLEPVLERGGASTGEMVKAGPVEIEETFGGGAPARSVITSIDGLLSGLVDQGGIPTSVENLMATTVAAIAAKAFDKAAAKLDVIKTCTVTSIVKGAYNTTTGVYPETPTNITGRAIMDQSKPIKDIFPEYVAGPGDTLFWLEGLSTAPAENDLLTVDGLVRTIKQVGDVAGAGTFFSAVVNGEDTAIIPANTVAPAISGTEKEEETLSVTTGTWTATPLPAFTYQWYADDVAISGATSDSYVLTISEVGAIVHCTVTATNGAGAVNADSNDTGAIASLLTLHQNFLLNSSAAISAAATEGPTLTYTRADALGTCWNENGVLVTKSTNEPRFDHDPANGNVALGLLIEQASANELRDCRVFDSNRWTDTNTPVYTQDQIGIDGAANTAYQIEDDNGSAFENLTQTVTVGNDSNTHTGSVFILKDNDETRFPELQLNFTGGSAIRSNVQINTKTGATSIRTATATTTANVRDYGIWWRLEVSTTNDTSGNTQLSFILYPAISTTIGGSDPATTGITIFDWAQLEFNIAFATSPIVTTNAATGSRAIDVCSTTDLTWLNDATGTLYAQASIPFAGAAERTLFCIDDGGATDRLRLYMNAAENVNFETINSSDTNGASDGAAVIAINTTFKAAGAYADDDVIGVVDGTASTQDTSAGIPVTDAATTARIGDDSVGTPFNGHIAVIKYWNVRRSNATLITETT